MMEKKAEQTGYSDQSIETPPNDFRAKADYQQLFDEGIDAVELLSIQGIILDCNQQYQHLVGRGKEAILGQHTTDLISDQDNDYFVSQLLPALEEDRFFEEDVIIKQDDGDLRQVWRRYQYLQPSDETEPEIVVYSRDITEKMEAVQELEQMALAIEQNPVALMITNKAAEIVYVNFQFSTLTGYSEEEALTKNLRLFKPAEQADKTFDQAWQQVLGGEGWRGEYRNHTKGGDSYWELTAIAPMWNMAGEITHVIVAKEDITARKESEAAALSSQQRLGGLATTYIDDLTTANEKLEQEIAERKRIEAALLDTQARLQAQYKGIPVPTFTWERQAGDFVLIDYNDAAAASDQGNIANLMGKSAGAIFKDRPQVIEDFAQCYATKAMVRREAPYQLLSTGETRHFVTTYNFVQPNLVIVHIQDVTEYKEIEAQLQLDTRQNGALTLSDEMLVATLSKEELIHHLIQVQTERKKVEDALVSSEQRFQAVADNIDERIREQYRGIPIPTYTWQYIAEAFILVDYNDAAAEAMGQIVDFVGKSAQEIFVDRPQVLADFERCITEKRTVTREAPYQMITSGESRYFVTSYVYTPPNLVIVLIQDVTDYKDIESELAEAKAQLIVTQWELAWVKENAMRKEAHAKNGNTGKTQILVDFRPPDLKPPDSQSELQTHHKDVPIATYFWEYQADGLVLVAFNEAAADVTKGSIQDFVGQRADAIFANRPQVLEDFARCYTGKTTVRREAPYKLITTGATKYFVTTYCYVDPNQVIVYIQDLTDYEQLKANLAESEAQMELVCRLSPDQMLTFVNEAYRWYFNQPREALLGQELPFIVEDDRAQVQERLTALTVEAPIVTLEYRVQRQNGDIRWQQWIYRAIFDQAGRLIEVQAMGRDISSRKQVAS